ncbi:unnamed protein product [Blepharisma stoltei]|uniref:LITAF domain-containing protein n=1 Tax=Blepharisma stoltei TaxID=1481888 RepID=A0AAU9KGT3_9CILI|nr:unnamed protein product [Blepharisma stoltei]
MYMQTKQPFKAANENTPIITTKLKAQIHGKIISNTKNKQLSQGLPSGTLKVQRKGVNLHLKPGSPDRYKQSFQMSDVASNMNFQSQRKPFKLLNYQDEPIHSRSPTTIINEVNQSYQFVSALSEVPNSNLQNSNASIEFSDLDFLEDSDAILSDFSLSLEEPKEKEIYKPSMQNLSRNSIFASTVEPRSQYSSELRLTPASSHSREERFSTIYTLSSDSSAKYVHTGNSEVPSPRIEENKATCTTRFTTNTLENELEFNNQDEENFKYERSLSKSESLPETPLGILPARAYCLHCAMDVSTVVRLELPTMPIWKRICCASFFGVDNLEKFQDIVHNCKRCRREIARVQPLKL